MAQSSNVQEYVQKYHTIVVGTNLRLTNDGTPTNITVSEITAYVTYDGEDAPTIVIATNGQSYSLDKYDTIEIL